jgi:succinate dehydrogenase/fumarate reductase flavoprotein subunit
VRISIIHYGVDARCEFLEVGDMRFVVIGGDAAGMSAASRAKRNRPDLEVTVLEQTGDVSYSA